MDVLNIVVKDSQESTVEMSNTTKRQWSIHKNIHVYTNVSLLPPLVNKNCWR